MAAKVESRKATWYVPNKPLPRAEFALTPQPRPSFDVPRAPVAPRDATEIAPWSSPEYNLEKAARGAALREQLTGLIRANTAAGVIEMLGELLGGAPGDSLSVAAALRQERDAIPYGPRK